MQELNTRYKDIVLNSVGLVRPYFRTKINKKKALLRRIKFYINKNIDREQSDSHTADALCYLEKTFKEVKNENS